MRHVSTLTTLALLLTAACGPDAPGTADEAIDRETFIDVQVDLRLAAETSEEEEVAPAERARILNEHGVSEEELRAFVEVHGGDEIYMRDLWAEVGERVREGSRERSNAARNAGASFRP